MRVAQGYIFTDEGRGTAVRTLTQDITRHPDGAIIVVTRPEGGTVRSVRPEPGSDLYMHFSQLLSDLELAGSVADAAPPASATA